MSRSAISARTDLFSLPGQTMVVGGSGAMSRATIGVAPVRVNVVSPGRIGMDPDRQHLSRPGTADDIGLAVASLVSNPAITGAVLGVDSGGRLGNWPS